jgi:exodeoxyribonuclease VII large subunit
LRELSQKIGYINRSNIDSRKQQTEMILQRLMTSSQNLLSETESRLNHIDEKLKLLNPGNILKKGFSITRANGKIIKSAADVKEGTVVETEFASGKTESKILKIKKI